MSDPRTPASGGYGPASHGYVPPPENRPGPLLIAVVGAAMVLGTLALGWWSEHPGGCVNGAVKSGQSGAQPTRSTTLEPHQSKTRQPHKP